MNYVDSTVFIKNFVRSKVPASALNSFVGCEMILSKIEMRH